MFDTSIISVIMSADRYSRTLQIRVITAECIFINNSLDTGEQEERSSMTVYPGSQVHTYEPAVFLHTCSQGASSAHSSTSTQPPDRPRRHPARHQQCRPTGRSVQLCAHPPLPYEHSFTSGISLVTYQSPTIEFDTFNYKNESVIAEPSRLLLFLY